MNVARRITWQVVLGVLPLFAGLAALGLVVNHALADRESERNRRTEAGAFAVTISHFIRPADWIALAAGRSADTELPAVWERLARWQRVRRIVVRDARDGRVVVRFPAAEAARAEAPPARVLAALAHAPAWLEGEDDAGGMIAHGPIRDAGAAIVGLVTVTTNSTQDAAARHALWWRRVFQACGIMLLGLAVSVGLGQLMAREVRARAACVRAIGTEAFTPPRPALVHEIDELGGTFGVLHNVLDETRSQARRTLVDSEVFRTEADLVAALLAESSPAWAGTLSGVALHAGGTRGLNVGGFIRATALPSGGGIAFLGQTAATTGLDAALTASAAGSYLVNTATTRAPAGLLASAGERFALRELRAVAWTASFDSTEWSWETATRPVVSREAGLLQAQHATVISLLGPVNRARGDLVGAQLAGRASAEIAVVLRGILEPGEPGLFLILRRAIQSETAS